MSADLRYREYTVSTDLKPYIRCLWRVSGYQEGDHHRVLMPDGCVDLIFNRFGSALFQRRAEIQRQTSESCILGAQTGPCVLGPTGTYHVYTFGIRVEPGAVFSLLQTSAQAFSDEFVELSTRFLPGELQDRILSEAFSADCDLPLVTEAIRKQLSNGEGVHPCISSAIQVIQQARGRIRTEEISENIGLTRQHLNRLFLKHVGMSPKVFCRVTRFNAVLEQFKPAKHRDLGALAYQFGYYDQSHFIADFKEFSGIVPSQFSWEKFGFLWASW